MSPRLSPSSGKSLNIPAAWTSAMRSKGRYWRRRSQAASVSTGQQVTSGGDRAANVSRQRRSWASLSTRRATRGPVSRRTRRSVTPEAFHVLGVGAQVVRRVLVDADDPDAARHVEAAFAG